MKSIFGIINQTVFETVFLEFFKCCCLHFAQIDYKEEHEHVMRGGIKHYDIQNEVQIETKEMGQTINEANKHFEQSMNRTSLRVT